MSDNSSQLSSEGPLERKAYETREHQTLRQVRSFRSAADSPPADSAFTSAIDQSLRYLKTHPDDKARWDITDHLLEAAELTYQDVFKTTGGAPTGAMAEVLDEAVLLAVTFQLTDYFPWTLTGTALFKKLHASETEEELERISNSYGADWRIAEAWLQAEDPGNSRFLKDDKQLQMADDAGDFEVVELPDISFEDAELVNSPAQCRKKRSLVRDDGCSRDGGVSAGDDSGERTTRIRTAMPSEHWSTKGSGSAKTRARLGRFELKKPTWWGEKGPGVWGILDVDGTKVVASTT